VNHRLTIRDQPSLIGGKFQVGGGGMNINTFRVIYHGAVMNDNGTLRWDHFADALQKYDPIVDLLSKRGFFNEMAGADGHLTWAKVENWFIVIDLNQFYDERARGVSRYGPIF